MIKEKLLRMLERDALIGLLCLPVGLIYENDGIRGFPFPWLQGTAVNGEAFSFSLIAFIAFFFVIDILRRSDNSVSNVQKQKTVKPNVVKNINRTETIGMFNKSQPSPRPFQISSSYKGTAKSYTSNYNRTSISDYSRGTSSVKGKSNTKLIIIICTIAIIAMPLLSILGSIISDVDEYNGGGYEESTEFSVAEDKTYDAITKLARGHSLGFDMEEINDKIDWNEFNSTLKREPYEFILFSNTDDDQGYMRVYSDDWKIAFVLEGFDLSSSNGYAEVTGIAIIPADEDWYNYTTIYEAGDCSYFDECVAEERNSL